MTRPAAVRARDAAASRCEHARVREMMEMMAAKGWRYSWPLGMWVPVAAVLAALAGKAEGR